MKNTLIYNNTIYVGKGENVDVVLHTDWTGWATDTYFYNNVFYVEGTARFSYGVSGNPDGSYVSAPGPGKSTNNVYDYNVYYGVPPASDLHALTSNPVMVNPGHAANGRNTVSGYALREHSPAIDSGIGSTNRKTEICAIRTTGVDCVLEAVPAAISEPVSA